MIYIICTTVMYINSMYFSPPYYSGCYHATSNCWRRLIALCKNLTEPQLLPFLQSGWTQYMYAALKKNNFMPLFKRIQIPKEIRGAAKYGSGHDAWGHVEAMKMCDFLYVHNRPTRGKYQYLDLFLAQNERGKYIMCLFSIIV